MSRTTIEFHPLSTDFEIIEKEKKLGSPRAETHRMRHFPG